MRGKKAKALRRAVYGGRPDKRTKGGARVQSLPSRLDKRTPAAWERREYQWLKRGYVGPHLRAKWAASKP